MGGERKGHKLCLSCPFPSTQKLEPPNPVWYLELHVPHPAMADGSAGARGSTRLGQSCP